MMPEMTAIANNARLVGCKKVHSKIPKVWTLFAVKYQAQRYFTAALNWHYRIEWALRHP